jgi:hypothetical protein
MRKAKAANPPVLSKEAVELACERLEEDCLSFVAGTHDVDPKIYVLRVAAADAAFDFLAKLRESQAPVIEGVPESKEQVIGCARVEMIDENKS